MDILITILFLIGLIFLSIRILPFFCYLYNEYKIYKEKNKEISDEDAFLRSTEEEILDGKIYHIIHDGINQQNQFARQEIRRIVIGEIMNRVKSESIKEEALLLYADYPEPKTEMEFKAEYEKYCKRKELRNKLINDLDNILKENNISSEWILRNGGFKNKPFPEYQGGPISWYNIRAEEYKRESFASYTHCVFGNRLPYLTIETVSDAEIELLLKFKDRLIEFHQKNPQLI